MKVTLKVIAERAGVHISTVDKVIHNRGGVSKEVEENIRSIIKELGYKTNPTGRALQRSGKRYRIAAVLLDVDARPYISAGIREEMEKVNFDVDVSFRISKFLDVEGQTTLLEEVISEGCDGIILMPNHSEKIERSVDYAKRSGIPVITVDSDIRRSGRLCHVGQDAVKSARIAGRMMGLFLRGEGKAAVITNSMDEEHFHDQVRTRVIEFTAFLRKNYPNIQIVRIVEGLEDRETIYANTVRLLREVPDLEGIFIACGGVDAANVLTFCYALSGFMAAIAGIVSVGRSGICNGANAIQPYDTDAIASCVIGGASFMGGKGTMFGTIIGAVLLDVTRESMAAKARRKEAAAKA